MPDPTLQTKTRQQLINEVETLRERVSGLEFAASERLRLEHQDNPISWANKLRRSEEHFRQLIEAVPGALLFVDMMGQITRVNKQAETLFGYQYAELVGKPIEILLLESIRQIHERYRADFFARPDTQLLGTRHNLIGRRKDGTEFPADIGLSYIQADNGNLALIFVTDISKQKNVGEKLQQANERFSSIFHASPIGISISTLNEDRFIDVNEAYIEMYGFRHREEVIGKTSAALGTWVNPEKQKESIQRLKEVKLTISLLCQFRHQSGEMRDALCAREVIDLDGETCILTMVQDITEKKRTEEALEREHNLLRTVIDLMPDNIFVKDTEGRFLLNNKVSLELLGISRQEDSLGKTDFDFWPSELAAKMHAEQQALVKSGQSIIGQEILQPWMSEKWRWLVYSTMPLRDENGQVIGLVGVTHDNTERKRAEERERAIAHSLRGVVEATDELITIQDLDTFYRRAVELAREKLQVERGAILLFNSTHDALMGTYGTDNQGRTTDERGFRARSIDRYRELLKYSADPWVVEDHAHSYWNGTQVQTGSHGWVATTLIRIDAAHVGIFSNDTAITHAPPNPIQQESIVLYCSLLGHILKRKQGEDTLRRSEQDTRHFQEQLRTLHEVGIELDSAFSVDELCRMAVELGRSRLGFDRMGLWLYEQNNTIAHATFGTDEYGQTTDDRGIRIPTAEFGRSKDAPDETFGLIERIASGEQQLVLHESVRHLTPLGAKLGKGWSAQAAMWDGHRPVGHIGADNLVHQQPVGPYQMDLLSLYGTTLGHLYTRKRTEAKILTLNAELQQQASRLSVLNEIARTISSLNDLDGALRNILDQIKKILPLDAFFIMLYDSNRDEIAFPLLYDLGHFWQEKARPLNKTGLAVQVISTGQPKLINRTEAEIKTLANSETLVGDISRVSASILMAPLTIGDALIGIIAAHSYTLNAYNNEHLALLIGAAYQIAIAVENARLYDVLRNELAERRQAEETIRKLNADLEQRVLDRTAALQQANERLQALSRIKDEFVSNVSHELRTPITSLKLRQYLIRVDPAKLELHLQVIERETERLRRTIEDLLLLSRLDQQQIGVSLSPLTIDSVIRDYVNDRVLTAYDKGLTLIFEGNPNLPGVLADKGLLEQTLAILLTNAINYTPSGGHIVVKTVKQASDAKMWIGFSVTDNGPGINPTDQHRLFERFFRGASARASGVAGTGLGLALAREIIDRHSGRIEIESSGIPGEGTCFTVWLPSQSGQVEAPTH